MGPKNKGCVTRRAEISKTPISSIFGGHLRSRIHRTGDQSTDSIQPFFTLPLNIEVFKKNICTVRGKREIYSTTCPAQILNQYSFVDVTIFFLLNTLIMFFVVVFVQKVSTVREALEALVLKNQLEGVTSSKTNEEVEAWQQVTIEELPIVLILHLKCFDYKSDGCTKILKGLEFPIDLKIDSSKPSYPFYV